LEVFVANGHLLGDNQKKMEGVDNQASGFEPETMCSRYGIMTPPLAQQVPCCEPLLDV
jgi:hypothetical protein